MPRICERELAAQRPIGILAGHAGDEDAGGGGEHERGDLRDQAVADGEQAVALQRHLDRACPRWPTPMASPPRMLMNVMMTEAMTSPLTNFIAPSIAP